MTQSSAPDPLDRIRFVLVSTSHPGNIGSAARAIRTMGMTRLSLVTPHAFPHPEAIALAAGADAVLDQAVISASLPAAIGDCRFVLGATARRRGVAIDCMTPREAAQRVLAAVALGQEVALVFGNERVGLDNDELKHCHAAITIPSDPTYSSLNLAQAVQVVAYELRTAYLAAFQSMKPPSTQATASAEQMEGFFEHLERTLDEIDFHKGRSSRTILQRLRRFFLRAQPDPRELRVLRGILADASRMARIAREKT
ncbi:MAG: RNA methyltransferase [Dokdonella sp.]